MYIIYLYYLLIFFLQISGTLSQFGGLVDGVKGDFLSNVVSSKKNKKNFQPSPNPNSQPQVRPEITDISKLSRALGQVDALPPNPSENAQTQSIPPTVPNPIQKPTFNYSQVFKPIEPKPLNLSSNYKPIEPKPLTPSQGWSKPLTPNYLTPLNYQLTPWPTNTYLPQSELNFPSNKNKLKKHPEKHQPIPAHQPKPLQPVNYTDPVQPNQSPFLPKPQLGPYQPPQSVPLQPYPTQAVPLQPYPTQAVPLQPYQYQPPLSATYPPPLPESSQTDPFPPTTLEGNQVLMTDNQTNNPQPTEKYYQPPPQGMEPQPVDESNGNIQQTENSQTLTEPTSTPPSEDSTPKKRLLPPRTRKRPTPPPTANEDSLETTPATVEVEASTMKKILPSRQVKKRPSTSTTESSAKKGKNRQKKLKELLKLLNKVKNMKPNSGEILSPKKFKKTQWRKVGSYNSIIRNKTRRVNTGIIFLKGSKKGSPSYVILPEKVISINYKVYRENKGGRVKIQSDGTGSDNEADETKSIEDSEPMTTENPYEKPRVQKVSDIIQKGNEEIAKRYMGRAFSSGGGGVPTFNLPNYGELKPQSTTMNYVKDQTTLSPQVELNPMATTVTPLLAITPKSSENVVATTINPNG